MVELEQCINFLLNAAQHTVFQYFSAQLAPYDITPAQYGVLSCLWSQEVMTPKQLGERLRLEASSISSTLDRLQKNDLIERNIDPEDRRTIRVSATKKGMSLRDPVLETLDQANQTILSFLCEEDRDRLRKNLLKIADLDLKTDKAALSGQNKRT